MKILRTDGERQTFKARKYEKAGDTEQQTRTVQNRFKCACWEVCMIHEIRLDREGRTQRALKKSKAAQNCITDNKRALKERSDKTHLAECRMP